MARTGRHQSCGSHGISEIIAQIKNNISSATVQQHQRLPVVCIICHN